MVRLLDIDNFKFLLSATPGLLVYLIPTVGCHKPGKTQKMITEFLTSKVFGHTDFVRMYILSKIYMSNIMFLFQIMGVKNVKCLCVTYKSSITS